VISDVVTRPNDTSSLMRNHVWRLDCDSNPKGRKEHLAEQQRVSRESVEVLAA